MDTNNININEVYRIRDLMYDTTREYKNTIKKLLRSMGGEFNMENGYGEDEPLIINIVDDNETGVIHYAIDKARYNDGNDVIEFHITEMNYAPTHQWIPSYLLGSEEVYALENIIIMEYADNTY